jgi:hypothetical protein
MSLETFRTQVAIAMDTGLPEDVITNTWHFRGVNAGVSVPTDVGVIGAALNTFYQYIDINFASNIAGSMVFKTYKLSDPEPRAPISTVTNTLTPSTDFGLPFEVALCLSYRAALVSGTNAARRRGRIYLGPFANTVSESSGGRVRPTTTLLTTIATAAGDMRNYALANDCPWVVYSPTDEAANNVVAGWIDNAWDTHRSRGAAATARSTF